jgi:hypothetical protein
MFTYMDCSFLLSPYLMTASVVQWSEFLATDPEVRVRFPALPDFLRSSGSGMGSTLPREHNWGATWKKKFSGSSLEIRDYSHRGFAALTTWHPSIRKNVGTNFTDKRRLLGQYSSLTDSGHGVCFLFFYLISLTIFMGILYNISLLTPIFSPLLEECTMPDH